MISTPLSCRYRSPASIARISSFRPGPTSVSARSAVPSSAMLQATRRSTPGGWPSSRASRFCSSTAATARRRPPISRMLRHGRSRRTRNSSRRSRRTSNIARRPASRCRRAGQRASGEQLVRPEVRAAQVFSSWHRRRFMSCQSAALPASASGGESAAGRAGPTQLRRRSKRRPIHDAPRSSTGGEVVGDDAELLSWCSIR